MTSEELIKKIVASVNPLWTDLEKIRYVYLEVGKELSKDADFFYTIGGKLGKKGLPLNKLVGRYNNMLPDDLKVTCYQGASILKEIYDELGIKSKIILSLNNNTVYKNGKDTYTFKHYFLDAQDEQGNHYFLTVVSDIPNIKMNLKTEHFAKHINYKKVINDKEIQVYDGPEIHETALSDEELRKIDEKIGYLNSIYEEHRELVYDYDNEALSQLRTSLGRNGLYLELEEMDTNFYRSLFRFNGIADKKISDIPDKVKDKWIQLLCRLVKTRIESIIGHSVHVNEKIQDGFNYNQWLKELVADINVYILLYCNGNNVDGIYKFKVDKDFNFDKYARDIRKEYNLKNIEYDYDNPLAILTKMNALVKFMNEPGERKGKFYKLLQSLSYHYVSPEYMFDESKPLTTYYIAHKFYKVFSYIMDTESTRNFLSDKDFITQKECIKTIIGMMYPEVTEKLAKEMTNYNPKYRPIENIIQVFSLKNKKTDDYEFYFDIESSRIGEPSYFFLYNPKNNKLTPNYSIKDVLQNYIPLNNRLVNKIEEDLDTNEKGSRT